MRDLGGGVRLSHRGFDLMVAGGDLLCRGAQLNRQLRLLVHHRGERVDVAGDVSDLDADPTGKLRELGKRVLESGVAHLLAS